MKAIVQRRYGGPEVLEATELELPEVKEDEVLVRVRAAALHIGDCFGVRGSPLPLRLMSGLRRPRYGVPGYDVAGTVAAVGSKVRRFAPGDAVFGVCRWPSSGAVAEYARAAETHLERLPEGLGYADAAAIPTSASAALHGLRDAGRLQAGQRVMINGASGGVGTFAVQIAKALGAEVTGVCSTANVELVRSIGADRVIDYTREDFSDDGARYDLILDNIEDRPLAAVRHALAPGGTLVLNSGTGARGFALLVRLLRPLLISPFVGHSLRRFLSTPNQKDLAFLVDLVERGAVRPVIDRTYALHETPDAVRRIETGHARGKVVVSVAGG